MADISKLLASAKLPQTTVALCLDGELAAAYAETQNELAQAKDVQKSTDSLSGGTAVRELEARLEQLRAEMEPATVGFVLRAVGRKRWTELVAEHPPRKDNAIDGMRGFNTDSLADALIREGLVEPELSAEQMDLLLDVKLSDGQYNELANAGYFVNRQTVSVPFSSSGSSTRRSTATE